MRPELERFELDCLSLQNAAATLEGELLAKGRLIGNPQEQEPPGQDSLLDAVRGGSAQEGINSKGSMIVWQYLFNIPYRNHIKTSLFHMLDISFKMCLPCPPSRPAP